jgi:ketosteroid isomerase-like protein
MEEARNTKVVQEAYAAFSRGDIPALHLSRVRRDKRIDGCSPTAK